MPRMTTAELLRSQLDYVVFQVKVLETQIGTNDTTVPGSILRRVHHQFHDHASSLKIAQTEGVRRVLLELADCVSKSRMAKER